MGRKPKHVYEIPCLRCPYEDDCAKKIKHIQVLSDQRMKMWNDAYLKVEDCSIYVCLSIEKGRKCS